MILFCFVWGGGEDEMTVRWTISVQEERIA